MPQVEEKNYYSLLNVNPTSTSDEIRAAYKKLALELMPDKNPENTEQFKLITQAYKTLIDAEQRAHYDKKLREGKNETLSFAIVPPDPFISPGCTALVVRTSYDLAQNILEQNMPEEDLVKLGLENEVIAEAICNNPELRYKLSHEVMKFGVAYENIAVKIVLEKHLWDICKYSIYYDTTIFQKHYKAYLLFLQNPELTTTLHSETLLELHEYYKDNITDATYHKSLLDRIHSYQFLLLCRTQSIDDAISDSTLRSHLLNCENDVSLLYELRINPRIRAIMSLDQKLKHYTHVSSFDLCFEDEDVALRALSTEGEHFTSYELYLLAARFSRACEFIFSHSVGERLSSPDLFQLLSDYGEEFFYTHISNQIRAKLKCYRRLFKLLNIIKQKHASCYQKEIQMFKDYPPILIALGKKYLDFAELICSDPEIARSLMYVGLSEIAETHEAIASTLAANRKLFNSIFIECDWLINLAKKSINTAKSLLTNPAITIHLSGEELDTLSNIHGISIRQIIENDPALAKKLRAFVLFSQSRQHLSSTLQKGSDNSSELTQAIEYFQMGSTYLALENNPVAQYYFHKAALLGYVPSIEALVKLTRHNDMEYLLKIAQIYGDPTNNLYDPEQAKHYINLYCQEENEQKILTVMKDKILRPHSSYHGPVLLRAAELFSSVYSYILESVELESQFTGRELNGLHELYKTPFTAYENQSSILRIINSNMRYTVKAISAYRFLHDLLSMHPALPIDEKIPLLEIIKISGIELNFLETLGCEYLAIAKVIYADEKLYSSLNDAIVTFGLIHPEMTAQVLLDEYLKHKWCVILDVNISSLPKPTDVLDIISENKIHLLASRQFDIVNAIAAVFLGTNDLRLLSSQHPLRTAIHNAKDKFRAHNNIIGQTCCLYVLAESGNDTNAMQELLQLNKQHGCFHPLIFASFFADKFSAHYDPQQAREWFQEAVKQKGYDDAISEISKLFPSNQQNQLTEMVSNLLPAHYLYFRQQLYAILVESFINVQLFIFNRNNLLAQHATLVTKYTEIQLIIQQEHNLQNAFKLLINHVDTLDAKSRTFKEQTDEASAQIYQDRSEACKKLLSDLQHATKQYYQQDYSHPDNKPDNEMIRRKFFEIIRVHLTITNTKMISHANRKTHYAAVTIATVYSLFSAQTTHNNHDQLNGYIANNTIKFIKEEFISAINAAIPNLSNSSTQVNKVINFGPQTADNDIEKINQYSLDL